MGPSSFKDDDSFWREFAASNNLDKLGVDPFDNSNKPKANKAGPARAAAERYDHRRSGGWKTPLQFAVAVLIAAIPISFYLVQPDDLKDAIATVVGGNDDERKRALREEARRISETLDTIKKVPEKPNVRTGTIQPVQQAAGTTASKSDATAATTSAAGKETAVEHAAKHADPNYVCPMHPSVVSKDPNATCPICGMDLVLLESGGDSGMVTLTPTVINSLGVRTSKAKRRTLYRRIDSVGYINVDEHNIRVVTLRTEGWIERLVVKTAGEHVTKGQLLFEVYSPKLVNAQDEYLQALHHSNEMLLKASHERLLSLGVSKEQIEELNKSGQVEQLVKVYAPQSGIVSELNVREGMHVKPSQAIVNLVDLSSVWLIVDIFERQADWVKKGQRAEATLPFMPGRSWEGMVEYVYPSLDASTRSLKVRLRFDNANEELKPNMYADVAIYAKPKKKALAIPREALIRTGKEQRVIVSLGEGKFMPMPVQVGMETDTKVEILSGLSVGDEVVTSSQFLIDSESNLKASLAKMAGGG